MKKLAMFLYKKVYILKLPLFQGKRIEAELAALHPGERVECVKTDYYVKKLSLCLTVLAAGCLLGIFAKVQQLQSTPFQEGVVLRGEYPEEDRQLSLEMEGETGKEEFQVTVSARQLSEEKVVQYAEELLERLPELILGENEDVEHVSGELLLADSYEGYPFTVTWESGNRDVLSDDGSVGAVEEPTEAVLYITLQYQDYSKEERLQVTVIPEILSEEERAYLELEEYLLESERNSRAGGTWTLPMEWKGKAVSWRLKETENCLLIWALTPIVCLAVYFSFDNDIHREVQKKQESIRRQYPELVHKLTLYIGAGMTIRGAFQKIGSDYEKKTNRPRDENAVGREVLYTCRELQSGIAEGAAYERFGRRIGLREYIKLGALLGQNLKRGNSTLTERLREEAEKACAESIQRARKLGEEAGTKLLIPMVVMLAIVMVMIMIPAFGGI